MKHIKNKRFLLYGSALFTAIVALGATIAYSHDSSVLPNEFNVGAHEVVMSETFVSPSNWKPGDETEKTLTVRNNSGSDIKVRVKYDEEWRNAAGTKTLPSIKDGVTLAQVVLQNENDWEPKADGYYYYKTALAPGATTSSLLQKVVFNREANLGVDNVCVTTDTGSVCEKPADDYEGAKYHLNVRVETIQPEFEEEEWLSFSVLNKGSIVKNALRDLAYVQTMTSLTFVDELPSDVLPDVEQFRKLLSVEGLPVYAYLSTRDFSSIYIYSEANKIYLNEDSSWLFSELGTISSLVLPNKLDASLVTDASYLFANSFFLKTLVLPEQFDMSRTRNMERMFSSLGALESLTFPERFDTSRAESMSWMFSENHLATLNLPNGFDTSNVRNMTGMFSGMGSLIRLDLPNSFNTSNVEDMQHMFSGMRALTAIGFSANFDTSRVKNMRAMFYDDRSLASLTLPASFDTTNVENMGDMFYETLSLSSLVLPDGFNTSNVRNMENMFANMDSITDIIIPNAFDTAKVTTMSNMFHGDESLTSLTLPSAFIINGATSTYGLFEDIPASAALNSSADSSVKALWPGQFRD